MFGRERVRAIVELSEALGCAPEAVLPGEAQEVAAEIERQMVARQREEFLARVAARPEDERGEGRL